MQTDRLPKFPVVPVLSAFVPTRSDTFIHTHSLTEYAMSALALAPIFARLRGYRHSRSVQAKYYGGKE